MLMIVVSNQFINYSYKFLTTFVITKCVGKILKKFITAFFI